MSSIVLVTVRPRMALCLSIKPLLQGLPAAVVHILILIFSQNVWNSVFSNSPALSTKILLGQPKIPIQYWKIFSTINSFFLKVTTQETLYLVAWSIKKPDFFIMGPFFKIHHHGLIKGFCKGKTNYWLQFSSFIFNANVTLFNWLYVLVMSHMRFRVNPHSIVSWMSGNSLLKAGAKSVV